MSIPVSIEINPRHVLEAMDDQQLVEHICLAASMYYHKRASALGHAAPAVHDFGSALNAFNSALDKAWKVKP